VTLPSNPEPPGQITFDLSEALELLAALEDARDSLTQSDHLSVLAEVEHQVIIVSRKLGFDDEGNGDGG
jgi:hypothetical protein